MLVVYLHYRTMIMYFSGRNEPLLICSHARTVHTTYSRVSRVMMMRMGLRFMPPTQLLLHMKLYKMVVNSVPTCSAS